MQNENKNENIRRVLLNRNIQAVPKQQNESDEKNKNKEKYLRSQKTLNKKNHVHYYSKSSNQSSIYNSKKELELTKISSYNEIDNEEYIDHPKPLQSENEEDLEELKSQFITKNETEKKETAKSVVNNTSLDLETTKKTKDASYVTETKRGSFVKEKLVVENDNTKKNILRRKRSENVIPIKKSYNYETIPINHIKAHTYFKINNINNSNNNNNINKTDYNIDKKGKENNQFLYIKNSRKKELNNNRKSMYQNSSFNLFSYNENKDAIIKRMKNENYNYMNITNNNKNIDKNNKVNKSDTLSDNSNPNRFLYSYNNKKRITNNGKTQTENNAEEKCEISNLKTKSMNIIQNNSNNIISKNQQKNVVLRNKKQIFLKNINNSIPIKDFKTLTSEKENESNKNGLNINSKNKTEEKNNMIYLSKIKSSEIKMPDCQKRHNILYKPIINNNDNNNTPKYRKKTFEKGGKFNNVQTTYIIISKNPNSNKISKVNLNPEIIDSNRYKFFNPTPSANCLNVVKLNNTENISPNYQNEYDNRRTIVNGIRTFIPNKSQNYLPVKRTNNYSDFTFDRNSYDTNYRNYIESSNIKNRDILKDDKRRNTCCFINRSSNINQNNIQLYDYNYDYFYEYNNAHFPNNSYLQYNYNTNY